MKIMNHIKLLVAAAAMLVASSAQAQFVSGPRVGSAVTVPSGGYILHSLHAAATNLASPIPFALSNNELKFYIDWGATNATTGVSNWVFRFQVSADGQKWVNGGTAGIGGLHYAIVGPGAGNQQYTNLLSAATVSGWRWIRLHSVTNNSLVGANSNTLYLTNIWFSQF